MTSSGGTYTYSTNVTRPGEVTINVIKYTQNQIYTEYYANQVWGGANSLVTLSSNVNFNWGTGAVFNGNIDHVSMVLAFKLYAPVTGTYTFETYTDDSTKLTLNGVQILYMLCCGTQTNTTTLTGGTYYEGRIQYEENTSPAYTYLYWTIPGGSKEIIPSSYFYSPAYLVSEQHKTITCADGYSKVVTSSVPS
jgi:hypothetical protein